MGADSRQRQRSGDAVGQKTSNLTSTAPAADPEKVVGPAKVIVPVQNPASPRHLMVLQMSKPYMSSEFIEQRLQKLRTTTETRETTIRLSACNYIIATGRFMQFPIRTIAGAMALYHRFHLFHPMAEMPYQEVAAACLFVACKAENTHKKLKEILIGAYSARHPDRAAINPTSQTLEEQRKRVNGLERMILEILAFDFRLKHPFLDVLKMARSLSCMDHSIILILA